MIRKLIRHNIRKLGYDLIKLNKKNSVVYPSDFEESHIDIINRVSNYTMTSQARIYSLIESVKYILQNNIHGSFVECGVYKGGSMMTVALTLLAEGVFDRELFLYDTFEGMPKPENNDVDYMGNLAVNDFNKSKLTDVSSTWANASLESVKRAMESTGYLSNKIHLIKGLVEDTIPGKIPDVIALLRLDTDWYKSTFHELNHLYPLVSKGGIIIIDDYGYFKGAKDAVHEYFEKNNINPLLNRIDTSARLIIKN